MKRSTTSNWRMLCTYFVECFESTEFEYGEHLHVIFFRLRMKQHVIAYLKF